MKKALITLLILYAISFFVFMLINQMTVSPGTSSGNGNPALLLAVPLIPILIVVIVLWKQIFRAYSVTTRFSIVGLFGTLTYLITALVYQKKRVEDYKEVIRSVLNEQTGLVDIDYLNSITSPFSIFVNNQYFNTHTFLIFIVASIFLALVYDLLTISDTSS